MTKGVEIDWADRVAACHKVIDDALAKYGEAPVYALFSGGHDSASTTHVVSQHPRFAGVIHINTGIGIKQTNQYVRDMCKAQGWNLNELHPPIKYLQLIIQDGFPGAGIHSIMYRMLKERALETFCGLVRKQLKAENPESKKHPIILCGGTRTQESDRRMGTVEVSHVRGGNVWLAPIHDWTALDTTEYMAAHGLPRNSVKDKLHISGECLCGCFADPTERREIEMWFPEVAAELDKLEAIIEFVCNQKLEGHHIPPKQRRWGWTDGIPAEQMELFPLCHYCFAGREKHEEHVA